MLLIALANWSESITPSACHAVLVPEYGSIVSVAAPEHAAFPK